MKQEYDPRWIAMRENLLSSEYLKKTADGGVKNQAFYLT